MIPDEIQLLLSLLDKLGPWFTLIILIVIVYFKYIKNGKITISKNNNPHNTSTIKLHEARFINIEKRLENGDEHFKHFGDVLDEIKQKVAILFDRAMRS